MGVDLYIVKHRPRSIIRFMNCAPWEKPLDYFRSSVNITGVLQHLDLPNGEQLDWRAYIPNQGYIHPDEIPAIREVFASCTVCVMDDEYIQRRSGAGAPHTAQWWQNYHQERHKELIAFLGRAISRKSYIMCCC